MIGKISILKKGIGIESKKVCKQVRDQKSMEISLKWSSVTIEQKDKKKLILRHLLSLF